MTLAKHTTPLQAVGASVSIKQDVAGAIKKNAVWIPVLTAFLLLLFTLNDGLIRDDYHHRALLLGEESFPGVKEPTYSAGDAASRLFSFFAPDSPLLDSAKKYGNVPWWTDNELKVSFWRPVAAITHWLDYQLWPDSFPIMHLHSLFWYALAGLLLGAWLIKLGVNGVALWLVMFLYVLDASHVHAIAWLANRNILIATVFGFACMLSLTHWNKQHQVVYLVFALSFYLLALLSAEAGVAVLGLVIAHLLVLDNNSIKTKVFVFLGFIFVTLGWRIVYSQLGYGALHSGFYVDPINDTANFIRTLFVNGPIMLYEQLIRIPSLSMLMSPAVELNQVVISLVVLLISLGIFLPLIIKNKLALFGLLAAIIALPPACATVISGGRLMFIFGTGICLLVGLWYAGIREQADWFQKKRAYKVIAYIWSAVLALSIISGTGVVWGAKILSSLQKPKPPFDVHTDILKDVSKDQVLVLLNPPVLFEQIYMPLKANYYNLQKPKQMLSVVPGLTNFEVVKISDHQLSFKNKNGFLIDADATWQGDDLPQNSLAYLAKRADRFFVSNHKTIDYKGVYNFQDVTLEVRAVNEIGDPTDIILTFAEPVFSDNYVLLLWDWSSTSYKKLNSFMRLQVKGPF